MGLADGVSLGNLDTFQPIVSNNSAPDCIVEIEDQDFSALAPERGDNSGHVIGVERNEFVRKGKLGQVPESHVMPVRKTNSFRDSGDVQQDVVRTEKTLRKLAVDAVDQTSNR